MTAMVITDEHLLALSSEQRAHLARRLAALSAAGSGSRAVAAAAPARPRGRRWTWVLRVLAAGACVAMIPWIAMLASTLPDRYVTHHWSTTWVGFDLLLLASFAATAVTAWTSRRRGQALWAATIVTATLLSCDAWFDITTASRSGLSSSLITACLGNLPLAGVLVYLGYRSLRHPSALHHRPADA